MNKLSWSRLLICFSLLASHFSLIYGQGVNISGKVNVTSQDKIKHLDSALVLVKLDGQFVATASIDTSFRYQMKINELKNNSARIDVYIARPHTDTAFAKSVFVLKNANLKCDLSYPNPHNKNVMGEVTCPKCGETNMVIPIQYSSVHHMSMHVNNGDTTYRSKEFYVPSGKQNEFSPAYYCKRCRIEF